jgi:glutamyl-tRNA synthetase
MDWGNAFVRDKEVGPSGEIKRLKLELNLTGDFRKTKKKVHWLAAPAHAESAGVPPVNVTLLDYDYLITKKKLEEGDELADFVTPVTEFRVEAVADGNVSSLSKGDIIQFERKGYYIYDGEHDGKREFIRIPDGRAAGLASKAAPVEEKPAKGEKTAKGSSKGKEGKGKVEKAAAAEEPTKMYTMPSVYKDESAVKEAAAAASTMYKVPSVYE